MESVRFDQKEEADRAVGYAIFGLKNEIMREVDKEVMALEARMGVKMNEARQTILTVCRKLKIWWQQSERVNRKCGGQSNE